MMKVLLTTRVLKTKLLEKYSSFSDSNNQINLFPQKPKDYLIKGQTELLLEFCRTIVYDGFDPIPVYLAVNSLIKEGKIKIHPSYQFVTSEDFLKVLNYCHGNK